MKNVVAISMLAVGLVGCAAGGGGGGYVHPLTNVRRISMETVASFSRTVKDYLTTGSVEQAVGEAQKAVANALKDPNAAQFRNVRLVGYLDGSVICGEVNGKNSYGGYIGFSPFVASTNAVQLYDLDNKYPDIQSASNAGINEACSSTPRPRVGQSLVGVRPSSYEPGKFQWPAAGMLIAGFDEVKNKGVAIGGNSGDPVYAAANGRVAYVGDGLRGYGKLIILKHDDTYLTAYAHNQSLLVNENQQVLKGQKIAEMGASETDQVKLLFEIRRNGKPVDPIPYLPGN